MFLSLVCGCEFALMFRSTSTRFVVLVACGMEPWTILHRVFSSPISSMVQSRVGSGSFLSFFFVSRDPPFGSVSTTYLPPSAEVSSWKKDGLAWTTSYRGPFHHPCQEGSHPPVLVDRGGSTPVPPPIPLRALTPIRSYPFRNPCQLGWILRPCSNAPAVERDHHRPHSKPTVEKRKGEIDAEGLRRQGGSFGEKGKGTARAQPRTRPTRRPCTAEDGPYDLSGLERCLDGPCPMVSDLETWSDPPPLVATLFEAIRRDEWAQRAVQCGAEWTWTSTCKPAERTAESWKLAHAERDHGTASLGWNATDGFDASHRTTWEFFTKQRDRNDEHKHQGMKQELESENRTCEEDELGQTADHIAHLACVASDQETIHNHQREREMDGRRAREVLGRSETVRQTVEED